MSAPQPFGTGRRVTVVHRAGAVVVAVVIAVFGVLGFVGGLSFFGTEGAPVLGLTTNGALSTISVVTAVVLVAAAIRGGKLASTAMVVIGALFLVSAFVNLWLIGTSANILAFRLPNVFFSIGAGLVLLALGAYGRATGRPTQDNPYKPAPPPQEVGDDPVLPLVADTPTDRALAEAERAAVSGTATTEQRRRLAALDDARTQEERRAVWRSFESGGESAQV